MRFVEAGLWSVTLAAAGRRVTVDGISCFVQPTIFTGMARQDPPIRDEIFGPAQSAVPFDTEAEAVAMANSSISGLAASVWTDDLSRACRVSDWLHIGTVSVNTGDALSAQTPLGGMTQSGFGRDLSLHSRDTDTALRTIWIRSRP